MTLSAPALSGDSVVPSTTTTVAVAAVLRSPDDPFVLERLILPQPGPGEVRIRVVAAGICHTDQLPRKKGRWGKPPIVLGHEGAGVVEEIGPGVQLVRPGDHVVASFAHCGQCARCRAGELPYCERFWPLNFAGSDSNRSAARDAAGEPVSTRWFGQSSFATHAVVAAASLVRVDPALPLPTLAPLGCGVLTGAASILHGFAVRPGATVAVTGVGAVGLAAVMAAKLAGASTIAAVDVNDRRLALARELGATDTIHSDGDLTAALRAAAPAGFEYCLDTTGIPEVITNALEAQSATGICGLVGSPRGPLHLGPTTLAVGRTIRGLLFGDANPQVWIPKLIQHWLDGRFPLDRLVTSYPLSAINDAERDCLTGDVVKPVLLPEDLLGAPPAPLPGKV